MPSTTSKRCLAKIGYYDDKVSAAKKCAVGCAACASATLCTYCSSNYFLVDNLCSKSCPARSYKDETTRTCQDCAYDCYTCANSYTCKNCNVSADFRVLNRNNGRCVAKAGYYDNLKTIAAECPKGCSACVSSTKCSYCF